LGQPWQEPGLTKPNFAAKQQASCQHHASEFIDEFHSRHLRMAGLAAQSLKFWASQQVSAWNIRPRRFAG
jgi:hypothetical protein